MDIPRESAKFWHDPALSNLEILHATYITHSFALHIHEGYSICVIERGVDRFAYRHNVYDAPAGSIVLINPGEPHTGGAISQEGWTYRGLYPTTDLLQRASSELVGRQRGIPFFPEPVVHDPLSASLLLDLHRALEVSDSALESESRMLWTMAQLVLRHADDHPSLSTISVERDYIKKARLYLEEHYTENVSLEELALHTGLSPFHLLRVFRRTVGLSPHTYLTQVRIRHARHLLLAGMPIAAVALNVGFVDQSHLTRSFKRTVGVPPGQFLQVRNFVQDKHGRAI